jgi:hypothetical protein
MKNTIKVSMPKYDASKMTGMDYDYVKLAYKLLCDGAVVETEVKDKHMSVKIIGLNFTMRMSFLNEDNPLVLMKYGNGSWSTRVVNAKGNLVMSHSNTAPEVIRVLGKLIDDVRVEETKADAQGEWDELEKYIK